MFVATLIILVDNTVSYRNAYMAAEDSTKLQALAIAVSLEATLMNVKKEDYLSARNIFRDIINEGKWEGIAFIALYERGGMTLLHSNHNLIGRVIKDEVLDKMTSTYEIQYAYITLGTGERVFTINMPVHLKGYKSLPVLRVALHTLEMDRIRAGSLVKAGAMTVVLLILWLLGILLWKAMKRTDRLKEELAERERLASIGEIAAVLAHEIRNPLGSIKGFAQYLLETASKDEDKEALNIIVSESARLENLTKDMLIYARPSEVKIEPVDPVALIRDVVDGFALQSREVNFDIIADFQGKIMSDRDKIKQAILNLINNALDAMDNRGVITIRLAPAMDGVLLTLRDTGAGIEDTIKKDLFKPFFTTKTRGTGLGLAIVKKIADCLRGEVSFISERGKGTEFRFFIRDLRDE